MLPKLVLRVRRAVRHLALRPGDQGDTSGAENAAGWRDAMTRVSRRDQEIESRLMAAERALNRLDRQ